MFLEELGENLATVILNFATLQIWIFANSQGSQVSIISWFPFLQTPILGRNYHSGLSVGTIARGFVSRPAITIPRPSKSGIRYSAMLLLTVPRRESEVALERKRRRKSRAAKRDHRGKRTKILSSSSARRKISCSKLPRARFNFLRCRLVVETTIISSSIKMSGKNKNIEFQSGFNKGFNRNN